MLFIKLMSTVLISSYCQSPAKDGKEVSFSILHWRSYFLRSWEGNGGKHGKVTEANSQLQRLYFRTIVQGFEGTALSQRLLGEVSWGQSLKSWSENQYPLSKIKIPFLLWFSVCAFCTYQVLSVFILFKICSSFVFSHFLIFLEFYELCLNFIHCITKFVPFFSFHNFVSSFFVLFLISTSTISADLYSTQGWIKFH